jgi:hypothetical protein
MKTSSWINPDTQLLGPAFPLPVDIPFTVGMALAVGVRNDQMAALVRAGLLRRVLHGVYAATQAPDTMRARAAALRLVLPPDTVVTDRAAAWLHGVDILHRGAHQVAPPVETSTSRDTRVRRPTVEGHRRGLSEADITEIRGVPVTTLLRTACDLGRMLWRFDALAAIDGALREGVDHEQLLHECERFRGYRGIKQLRVLAPLGDARSQSPGESALRLHWFDAGLPRPDLQYEVYDDAGFLRFRLDVPAPEVRYAAEYDGEKHHTDPEDLRRDQVRRDWLARERRWSIDAFTRKDVYHPRTDITDRLRRGFHNARRAMSYWNP